MVGAYSSDRKGVSSWYCHISKASWSGFVISRAAGAFLGAHLARIFHTDRVGRATRPSRRATGPAEYGG
jgi:hypothetical protein